MKVRFLIVISLFILGILLIDCSTTRSTSRPMSNDEPKVVDDGYQQVLAKDVNQSNVMVEPNKDRKSNMSLDDMIRRLPGVQVSGNGRNARIKVSGAESFMAGTDPLFVVNGVAMPNYDQVFNTVNPNDITSLTVLKGADATIYGTRGANGVIVIRTKK